MWKTPLFAFLDTSMTSAPSDDPFSHPSQVARAALAARFGLQFHEQMQDWEWEVADSTRFEEFLKVYHANDLDDPERHSLMELLIQCIEDMEVESLFDSAWLSVESLLLVRSDIHHFTIEYWACLDENEADAIFKVSPNMRKVWQAISG